MNILFIGTVEFSKKALETLINIDNVPVGVLTKDHSLYNADYANLIPVCKKHKIPYHIVKNINSIESIDWMKKCNPDVIFCFGWSTLLKRQILDLPPLGVIGFHPAALPKNRGRHPIVWSLALGLYQTASTFFFMDEGADSGDILSQKKISIDYGDYASVLYERICNIACKQIECFTPKLKNGNYTRRPQDHSQSNYWRKRIKADGRIDFRMSSRNIYNLIRALGKPYIGAHVEYKEQEIKIWRAVEYECTDQNIEPGKVITSAKNELVIKCGSDAISLIEHDFTVFPQKGEYLI